LTTILLVRHGQTEWNRIERFRGRVDIELNSNGLIQAEKTAMRIQSHWKPAIIYSSPLKRALQTAQAIAEMTNVQVESSPDLVDIDYGDWQGLSPEEARLNWPDQLDAWYKHPEIALIPAGENLLEVQSRAMSKVKAATKTYPDKIIVMVSHTVVNRLILLGIMGIGIEHFWQLRQEPCAINIINSKEDDFSLVTMNDTCHLEP